jgi:hypothetical protein
MSDSEYFSAYGNQLLSITTTLFASYFTVTTLLTITSQRELLIGIFLMLWVFVYAFKTFINQVLFYEESAEYYKLVIQVVKEDRNRKNRDGLRRHRIMAPIRFPQSMYINENNDVVIDTGDPNVGDIVYITKKNPVKQAFLQLCDFFISVIMIVVFSIIINVYVILIDAVSLEWYNYIIVYSIPVYLIFVFFVFRKY